jgi:hypothetical protein
MKATEDLFTPIHKALRSMIYSLGSRLQTNDFSDVEATRALVVDLENDFEAARSAGCIVCVLHHHAEDEESVIFPAVAPHSSGLIGELIEEHHDLARRELEIVRQAHEILALPSARERVRRGIEVNQAANELFARYLVHMNREDVELVPLMQDHFTDEQMRTMRGTIMSGIPPERLRRILQWMLPSLNVAELTDMMSGLKRSAPPELVGMIAALGAAHVEPTRWQAVRQGAAI